MPFVILLLLAILIVLIGGPLALGFTVAVPAYLVWASGILQFLFWVFVVVVGGVLTWVLIGIVAQPSRSLVSDGDTSAMEGQRIRCGKCGTERDVAFEKCFNCDKFELKV